MSERLRVMVSSGFGEGHALPALALSRTLAARGHDVLVELSERWRERVLELGLRFTPASDYILFPEAGPQDPTTPTVADVVRSLVPVVRDFQPDVVVGDLVASAPLLAAEAAGVRGATLIPTLYPVQGRGLPPYPIGFVAPRTALGSWAWRAIDPPLSAIRPTTRWLRKVPAMLDAVRADIGLPRFSDRNGPLTTTYGAISEGLGLVATFPQLEYRRAWPRQIHVTGPMQLELPHPDIALPPGDEPLVVVAASTVQPGRDLVAMALDALQDEAVRVVATLNRRGETWTGPVPANATVTDWLSYGQVMPGAALVISSGGHGTVVRALSEGAPVLVCPTGADTAENGARITWAGAGLMLPARLHGPRPLRWSARRLLCDRRFGERAREIAAWGREHDGAARGAELVERYARR